MIIKKKSLIVALVSGSVISLVLVLTLVGYAAYLELKNENFVRSYEYLFEKLNAKNYSKYIELSKLNAGIQSSGALKGYPVIEGVIRNSGNKDMADLLMKVRFLDRDGAVIYEVVFRPQEPSLGASTLTQAAIPYITGSLKVILKPNGSLPFKKILIDCPREILSELKNGSGFARGPARWSGKFEVEALSLSFQESKGS